MSEAKENGLGDVQASAGIDFEPLVSFPDHPFDAARVFLAVLAYPEGGAGQPGGLGIHFTEAMWKYFVWNGRRAKGLRYVREKFEDASFQPPVLRDFQGTLERGTRRIKRRTAAYGLVGNQMLNGFMRVLRETARLTHERRRDEAVVTIPGAAAAPARPELWEQSTRSPLQIISRDVDRWARKFGLNRTGTSSDSQRKAKDLVRRAYLQSRPVLHMAHAFDEVCCKVGEASDEWGEDTWLLLLLSHPEEWVWDAIDVANRWRLSSHSHLMPHLEPGHMIELVTSKKSAR